MSGRCQHCGCTDIEVDPARGDAVCTSCGTVLSEHNIVSEVQFLENAHGGSSAVGQFVSSDSSSKRPVLKGFHGSFGRESKEITLNNAKKKINALAQQLRLSSHSIETSFNFFKLGLSKGLTRGRKTNHVIGACVYITCRTEQTAHMLIDVSDALQIDVYELGRTYLRLSTALCIHIPAMDPCLYIWRFSYKLSFGDKTHDVSETALRLVKRMKRDWMHTGRRPSGVCGAALVIAARLHNFNRTINDVIKVVKVHESTLRKRLTEFGETPSSALTPEEFMKVDLAEEQDPPAFRAARKRERERIQLLVDQQDDLDSELTELQQEIEKHLEERKRKLRGIWAKYDREEEHVEEVEQENVDTQKFIAEETIKTISECMDEKAEGELKKEVKPQGIRPTAASLGLKETIEECMEIRPNDPEPEETGELDLAGIDDDEISSYILSSREVNLKTEMWMKLNKDYLEEMKLKEEREKKEAEEREKEGKPPKKKKTYTKKSKNNTPANTAGEAIEKMLMEKKLSNKINYDVLRSLNGEEEEVQKDIKDTKPVLKNLTPVETPKGINSVLESLTGKRARDSIKEEDSCDQKSIKLLDSVNGEIGAKVADDDDPEEDDDEEEEEEEEDLEDESNLSTLQLLRKRRGEDHDDYYDDDYD
ncbi:hypothetical protein Pcinc_008108 [Petrolisthes cinctipes]|uniref:B-related factor 1 n=1 Tax=Petrolisthes cinctipes TaxID=88211 RepID=A0AAE1G9M0_PETCI|nr:hypothetical protein Pcinc_008108 [Petrolisthes cinctipes]